MKTEQVILLKLGGSIITDKGSNCTPRHDQIEQIVSWISVRWPLPLMLVHGAGSCGHPEAHRYGLASGLRDGSSIGIPVTHEAVSRLNDAVVQALRRNGIPAIGVHPLQGMVADNGRLVQPEVRHIMEMVRNGLLPVLHGDVVMDLSRGACIISGDQLVVFLSQALGAVKVGLATDVPGVMYGRSVIPVLTPQTVSDVPLGGSGHTDVTGGMQGKIQEMLVLAVAGKDSEIFHVSRIPEFLDGKSTGGTRITGEC